MLSNAVGPLRKSKILGYEVAKGTEGNETSNLPMRIVVFGQANTALQGGLTNAPFQVFSAKEVGEKYGFGSQLHIAMRIIRNQFGDRTAGIPTIILPQLEPSGGVAEIQTLTVTGTATGNSVHIVKINGRSNFDGKSLEIAIATGDTPTLIAGKISDAVNNAPSCPVSTSSTLGVVEATCKWEGENTTELNIEVDLQEIAVGISYAVAVDTAGAGDSSAEITTSLALMGDEWTTIVVSPYFQTRDHLFETKNGIPGEIPASGQYSGEIFKPFVVFRGSKLSATISAVTAGLNKEEGTISVCSAPESKGWEVEAAANVCSLTARQAQDSPHEDTSGLSYPDMPIPSDGDIGVFDDYNTRDAVVKAGVSGVILRNGAYEITEQITTYYPDNEDPAQFSYVRSLIQDWNIKFQVYLVDELFIIDHAIAEDRTVVTVNKVIKPKQVKALMQGVFALLAERVIITDPEFSAGTLQVSINADRIDKSFQYKRSGFARIISTTATANFSFNVE